MFPLQERMIRFAYDSGHERNFVAKCGGTVWCETNILRNLKRKCGGHGISNPHCLKKWVDASPVSPTYLRPLFWMTHRRWLTILRIKRNAAVNSRPAALTNRGSARWAEFLMNTCGGVFFTVALVVPHHVFSRTWIFPTACYEIAMRSSWISILSQSKHRWDVKDIELVVVAPSWIISWNQCPHQRDFIIALVSFFWRRKFVQRAWWMYCRPCWMEPTERCFATVKLT